jgi:nickel/cobalt transporter (NiCoT) family protein
VHCDHRIAFFENWFFNGDEIGCQSMNAVAIVGLALGMRHGTDPDHLAAIDGLTRIRPRATNGIYFAMGHGLVVILLAIGIGRFLANRFAFIGPWSLILIGAVSLWRLLRGSPQAPASSTPTIAQPFLLGMLLAAGFETALQLSALILAGQTNAWIIGAAFSLGMVAVDGLDGYLAASTQRLAATGEARARTASRVLGIVVVFFAFSLGGAELFGVDLARVALPLGLTLFVIVLGIRIWARSYGEASSRFEPDVDERLPAEV